MFLYDRARTANASKAITGTGDLRPVWTFRMRSYPAYASETQVVQDEAGHLYFGGHDGVIYSVTDSGKLRWMFKTARKIYASPLLVGSMVIFCSGDGMCLSLDCASGELVWMHKVATHNVGSVLSRATALMLYDYDIRQRLGLRLWASPNASNDNKTIYCVARGAGLVALDADTGKLLWSHDLGWPRQPLSGPVIDSSDRIYAVGQRGQVVCLEADGRSVWQADLKCGLNFWGQAALDEARGRLYLMASWKNETGRLFCLDMTGKKLWSQDFKGALRGGIAVDDRHSLYLACGNGSIYHLDDEGRELHQTQLTHSKMLSLWTTPTLVAPEGVLVSAVLDQEKGGLFLLNRQLDVVERFECGKALAPPFIDRAGRVLFGSWDGYLYCLARQ